MQLLLTMSNDTANITPPQTTASSVTVLIRNTAKIVERLSRTLNWASHILANLAEIPDDVGGEYPHKLTTRLVQQHDGRRGRD